VPMISCFFSFVIAISRPNATGPLVEAEFDETSLPL
jgi:hypothetical protein